MKINKEHRFTVNISCEVYETKPGSSEISRMYYNKTNLTSQELINLLMSGHSFCPFFGDSQKRRSREYWTGTPFICVDIDDTMYEEIPDFIGPLRYRPTLVYPSYTDGSDKHGKISRRFHLVYIFEDPITDRGLFYNIAEHLCKQIESNTLKEITDKTWIDPTRYFNGVTENPEYYLLGNIYNTSDFTISSSTTQIFTNEHLQEKTSIQEMIKFRSEINDVLLKDIDRLDHDTFYKYWGPRLKYIYESEDQVPGVESFYQVTGEDYFKLPFWKTRKLDGSHRRIWVYTRMCLRRVMCPGIDINTLIYCAYQDVYFSVDNSDGVFCSEYHKHNALAAFEYTIDETSKKFSGIIDYYKSIAPSIRTAKGRLQEARFLEYDRYPEELKNTSRMTQYNYRKSRGLIQKTDWSKVMTYYDSSMSLRKNLEVLRGLGYKVSLGKLQGLLKNNK